MYMLTYYFVSVYYSYCTYPFYDFTETDAISKALAGAMSGNSKSSDGRKGPASRGKYNIQQIDTKCKQKSENMFA